MSSSNAKAGEEEVLKKRKTSISEIKLEEDEEKQEKIEFVERTTKLSRSEIEAEVGQLDINEMFDIIPIVQDHNKTKKQEVANLEHELEIKNEQIKVLEEALRRQTSP